jgi:hypothetical protein
MIDSSIADQTNKQVHVGQKNFAPVSRRVFDGRMGQRLRFVNQSRVKVNVAVANVVNSPVGGVC